MKTWRLSEIYGIKTPNILGTEQNDDDDFIRKKMDYKYYLLSNVFSTELHSIST